MLGLNRVQNTDIGNRKSILGHYMTDDRGSTSCCFHNYVRLDATVHG